MEQRLNPNRIKLSKIGEENNRTEQNIARIEF